MTKWIHTLDNLILNTSEVGGFRIAEGDGNVAFRAIMKSEYEFDYIVYQSDGNKKLLFYIVNRISEFVGDTNTEKNTLNIWNCIEDYHENNKKQGSENE